MPSTYDQVATYTFPSNAATYTFTSIPATYTDLILAGDCTVSAGGGAGLAIQFNSDTGNNYVQVGYYSSGSGSANNSFSGDKIYLAIVDNVKRSAFKADILNYANAATNRNVLSHGGELNYLSGYFGMWKNTANAINSITVRVDGGANILAGSIFSLYGILKA